MWWPSSRCLHLCSCHGCSLLLMLASFSAVLSRLIVVFGTSAVIAVPMLQFLLLTFLLLTFMLLSSLPCCPPLWDVPSQVDCCLRYTIFLFLSSPCPPFLLPFLSFSFHINAVSFVARYLSLFVGPCHHLTWLMVIVIFVLFRICCSCLQCCCWCCCCCWCRVALIDSHCTVWLIVVLFLN